MRWEAAAPTPCCRAAATAAAQSTARTPRGSWIPLTSYGYVGANIGATEFDTDCIPGRGCDRTDYGFKVYTGGQLWRFVGLEASYVNVGKARVNGGSAEAQGVNVSALANLPIGTRFNLFGKVGSTYGFTRVTSQVTNVDTGRDHGFGLSYGAGASVDLTGNWQLRPDWDRYRFDFKGGDSDVNLYTLGLVYKF